MALYKDCSFHFNPQTKAGGLVSFEIDLTLCTANIIIMYVCVSVGQVREPCKTAELIGMPFWGDFDGPRNHDESK